MWHENSDDAHYTPRARRRERVQLAIAGTPLVATPGETAGPGSAADAKRAEQLAARRRAACWLGAALTLAASRLVLVDEPEHPTAAAAPVAPPVRRKLWRHAKEPPPEAEPEGLGADDLLANVPLQPSSSWLLAALWLKSLGWRWPFCWGWFVALGIEEAFKVSTAALLD